MQLNYPIACGQTTDLLQVGNSFAPHTAKRSKRPFGLIVGRLPHCLKPGKNARWRGQCGARRKPMRTTQI